MSNERYTRSDRRRIPNQTAPGQTPRTYDNTGNHRVHMGTASSDPNYLPPTKNKNNPRIHQPRNRMTTLKYDRYLEAPRSKRSIFTAQQDRTRHRLHLILVFALIVVIVALIILFVL